MVRYVRPALRRRLASALVVVAIAGCGPAATASPASTTVAPPSAELATSSPADAEAVVLVGRIVTMDEPPVAEALLIDDGTVVAVGTREDVLALPAIRRRSSSSGATSPTPASSTPTPTGSGTASTTTSKRRPRPWTRPSAAAGPRSPSSGSTPSASRSSPPSRKSDALPLRVDAYLALNYDREFLGDWYTSREPGPVDDHLRVEGLKIHLDDGWGHAINWDPAELTATIGRADEAGWQVSVHAMSSAAMELVLDAFEASLGPTGPNPLHHRIEHAMQVTDEQLARLVAMDIAIVTHFDGANDWLLDDRVVAEFDRD